MSEWGKESERVSEMHEGKKKRVCRERMTTVLPSYITIGLCMCGSYWRDVWWNTHVHTFTHFHLVHLTCSMFDRAGSRIDFTFTSHLPPFIQLMFTLCNSRGNTVAVALAAAAAALPTYITISI